jgi:outer membrane cobalamin receptor
MPIPRRATLVSILFILILPFAAANVAGQDNQTASLSGRVVDARSGEALAKVKVIVSGTDKETTTDENGKFALDNLKPGKIDLYITTVTFGLVKKSIVLHAGDNSDLQIALNEDAAALTENVTVTTEPFESTDSSAINQQLLNKRELQQLSSVLLNDPIRAAQALPGVTANDDFRSEFSVRGAGFDRVGLYVDGVLTENFLHLVAGGYPDTGSISVINADTVDTVALMSGGYPANYGYRSAAMLDIQTRNGNRVKPTGRVQAGLTGLAGVVDGPFAGKRASYLVAARKSFTGFLVRRFNEDFQTNNPPVIDVADIDAKALYDLSKRNQIGASVIFGNFDFDRNRDRDLLGSNQVFQANNKNLLVNAHWTFTRDPHLFVQTRLFALRTTFKNVNHDNNTLEDGHRTQFGVRSDLNYQAKQHRVEAGLYLRHLQVQNFSQQFDFFGGPLFALNNFDRSGLEQGYYIQDNWRDEKRRVALTGGVRLEHSSVTRERNFSPRGSFSWAVDDKWKISAAAGRYYQFPDFQQVFGFLGNRNLKSEEATHYSASIERLLGSRARIFAEVYDREDRKLFINFNEPLLFPIFDQRFRNSLSGHARGIELMVQRRSANKLAGWVSYSYSRTRLTESRTGLTFPSDYDQRHTLNVYGNYRFADTWNLSSEWRYGSGQPIAGFYGHDAAGYFLTTQRNQVRVPYYSRVDVRLSKAFLFRKAKLTVTGEVLNLLNRENLRFVGFDFFGLDGRAFGKLDRILPILPSAGVVIEF